MKRQMLLFMWFVLLPAFGTTPIMVLGPDGGGFDEVLKVIPEELGHDFEVSHRLVNERTGYDQFENYIKSSGPRVVVLMDNVSINYFRRFQTLNPDIKIPAVACMALFMDQAVVGLNQVIGIRYEVPAVTSLVSLRDLIQQPVDRVGVIYREMSQEFFERQKDLCAREQIELIGVAIPNVNDDMSRAVRKAFDKLKKSNLDALWVVNDSGLLSREALTYAWIPRIKRMKKPVVVGVRPLVEGVGHFAVLPDHQGIGLQITNAIFEIVDNNFELTENHVVNPVAVRTVLNLNQEGLFTVANEKLGQVDVVIQR
ncbi:MAG: hypothetical protein KDC35_06810 [Acidobacteria bacterium]|nr:hypothetical protein [Acidobacteriota bacterium]